MCYGESSRVCIGVCFRQFNYLDKQELYVCLVKDCDELEGGIYKPAYSMGKKLIRRLVNNAGLSFSLDYVIKINNDNV